MNIEIEYKGVKFDVDFWYQPYEPAETGIEAQYAGCPESVEEISEFKHKGTCFLEFIEDDEDTVKEIILNSL